jgi:hypothetical protein
MSKLLNAEQMRKDLVGKVRNIRTYSGTATENKFTQDSKILHNEAIKISNTKWMDSVGRDTLLRERHNLEKKAKEQFENASTGFDRETIAKLAGLYTIDLVRQADDLVDYTPVLFKEIFDENAPESVNLRDVTPYIGKEEDVEGSGDTVPLMKPSLPVDVNVNLKIRGFGDKTTIRQLVFNPFHKTEKVIESAARISADEKNNDSFGPILSATYSSVHQQAADTTGATYVGRTVRTKITWTAEKKSPCLMLKERG